MAKCNCKTCILQENWQKAKKDKNIEEMDKLFEELFSWFEHEELDREVYDAIFEGDWPSSVERLEAALEKAKKRRAETIAEDKKRYEPYERIRSTETADTPSE